MIGKVALTEVKGELFVITSEEVNDKQETVYKGFKITPKVRGEKVEETKPRVLCDIQDLLDYGKVAYQTRQLIVRESEAREKADEEKNKATKSLDPVVEPEEVGPLYED